MLRTFLSKPHHFASLPDGGESTHMDPDGHVPAQPPYLPARVPIVGTVKHSLRKLVIALVETPERACGVALRVGYIGTRETDLALYRLKVKPSPELPLVTLAGFFVLEEGRFHTYER